MLAQVQEANEGLPGPGLGYGRSLLCQPCPLLGLIHLFQPFPARYTPSQPSPSLAPLGTIFTSTSGYGSRFGTSRTGTPSSKVIANVLYGTFVRASISVAVPAPALVLNRIILLDDKFSDMDHLFKIV